MMRLMLKPLLAADLDVASSWPASEIFESAPWFSNLLAHGFEHPVSAFELNLLGETLSGCRLLLMADAPHRLSSLSNYYSSVYGPVGDGAQVPAAAWQAAAQCLRLSPHGAVVQLQPMDRNHAWVTGLTGGLGQVGYWVDSYFCFGNWYLEVAQRSFADYFAGVPSALRNSVQRGRRRLDREAPWQVTIQRADDKGLAQAVADFEAVYRQSWKQAEPCPGFMPGLITAAARHGWLRLGVLTLRGVPIAAQLWLVHQGKANIFKLAYVQGYERFSAGSVLTATLMQHVLDVDRVREVDYLTGDDAYKQDWMSHRRERTGLIAFHPWHLHGLVAALRHYGAKWLQRWRTRVSGREAAQPVQT
jgi:hypothetical protein